MKADFKILWNNCLNVIRDNISEAAFNTWFAPIIPLSYKDNVDNPSAKSVFMNILRKNTSILFNKHFIVKLGRALF